MQSSKHRLSGYSGNLVSIPQQHKKIQSGMKDTLIETEQFTGKQQ